MVRPKKCVGDSDAFATPHLIGYYVHKLTVLNGEVVCLGVVNVGNNGRPLIFL